MALRDELRKEVAEIESQRQRESERRMADEAFYRERLVPVMRDAHTYFAEVVANLQIISPDIFPGYPLNPTSDKDVRLRQCDYKYRVDDGKAPREIDVVCQAVLDRPVEFFLSTRERAEKHAILLDSYDFAYHRKNYLDKQFNVKGATFFLEGPMRVYFRIAANAEDRCLYIDLRNLGDQRSKRYRFTADEFNESLFDRLSNVLLRREEYLVPPKVGSVERDQLQRQLDLERREREADLADAFEQQASRKQAEQDALLRNRTRNALSNGSRGFFQRIRDGVDNARTALRGREADDSAES